MPLGRFSTPSLCYSTISFLTRLTYWLSAQFLSYLTPYGTMKPLSPSTATEVPTGNQEMLRKVTLQGLSLLNCLQMFFGMLQSQRSCLSRALNRNRIGILHFSSFLVAYTTLLRHISDHFVLSPPFPSPSHWNEDKTMVSPQSSMSHIPSVGRKLLICDM